MSVCAFQLSSWCRSGQTKGRVPFKKCHKRWKKSKRTPSSSVPKIKKFPKFKRFPISNFSQIGQRGGIKFQIVPKFKKVQIVGGEGGQENCGLFPLFVTFSNSEASLNLQLRVITLRQLDPVRIKVNSPWLNLHTGTMLDNWIVFHYVPPHLSGFDSYNMHGLKSRQIRISRIFFATLSVHKVYYTLYCNIMHLMTPEAKTPLCQTSGSGSSYQCLWWGGIWKGFKAWTLSHFACL